MEDIDLDCVSRQTFTMHIVYHTQRLTYASNNKKNIEGKTHRHKDTLICHTSFVAMTLVAGDNYKSPADLRVCGPK